MSKLLDRLDRITRGSGRTLGFAPAAARETLPTMVLVAQVEATEGAGAVKAGADAVLLPLATSPEGLPAPKGTVWGAEVAFLDKAQADTLRAAGCDFLVFGIDGTLVEALEEGECTRILRVSPALEENQLRCLEDLPVDVVIVTKPALDGPLSLAHLLSIANVRAATSRYLLLEWNAPLSGKELEHLRDMGVDGILLKGASDVATCRERINALPPRRPRNEKDGRAPVLPRLETGFGPSRQRQPEPDEEEDDDY
ncbi:MAG: hypothetical protein HY532_03215 [Chloroflexi bacterium]|nr:hypothetical protein [Chloroflexota bacterium]